jgi:cytochrome P450
VTHRSSLDAQSDNGGLPASGGPPARAPIHWDEALECWIVSDQALAREVLAHRDFSSATFERSFQLFMSDDARHRHRELAESLNLWFVQADAPQHATLRRPLQRALSPAYFRSLTPRITEIVDAALDDLAVDPRHDVVPAVAEVVSARVMATVVGIDGDPALLHGWAKRLSAFIGAMYRKDYAQAAQEALEEMAGFLSRSPVVARYQAAQRSEGSRDEARTMATWAMSLFGGLETTSSLLSSVVLVMLTDRDAWHAIRAGQPGAAEATVESVLQHRPPLRHLGRVSAREQEVAGAHLAAGDLVLVTLTGTDLLEASEAGTVAAAAFARPPDPGGSGPGHLAFGHGPHYCVGAPLARVEAAVLARRFAARFPAARLVGDAAVWGRNLSYVGLDHLYVEWEDRI